MNSGFEKGKATKFFVGATLPKIGNTFTDDKLSAIYFPQIFIMVVICFFPFCSQT